jgi:outer membrane receptor protein involved in Fe transport
VNLVTRRDFEGLESQLYYGYAPDGGGERLQLSQIVGVLNEVGKPADTRVRAMGGWTRGAWGASLYINRVDGYANPFSTPPSSIDSWTTVDLSLRFRAAGIADSGFLDGLDATLGVQNLLDEDPPMFPNSLQGVLYDSTNASPFGRFVSLRLSKQW